MNRQGWWFASLLLLPLAACGVSETAATAAAGGAVQANAAEETKRIEQDVQRQLDANLAAGQARLQEAEAGSR